jgi:hypothetical protein
MKMMGGAEESRECEGPGADWRLGQMQPAGWKEDMTRDELEQQDIQKVTVSVLQEQREDDLGAIPKEQTTGNNSDHELAVEPRIPMGNSSTGAGTIRGVDGKHPDLERHMSPQRDAAMLAKDATYPTNGSEGGRTLLKGWDSDLTDLPSDDDGESEIDMIESDDVRVSALFTLPKPILALEHTKGQAHYTHPSALVLGCGTGLPILSSAQMQHQSVQESSWTRVSLETVCALSRACP